MKSCHASATGATKRIAGSSWVALLICAAVYAVIFMALGGAPAAADDCLRDPFNAEDCLRSTGWAPVIAGSIASLISILTSIKEIPGTLHASAAGSVPGWRTIWDRIGTTYEKPEETEARRQREQETADKITKSEPIWRVVIAGAVGALTYVGVAALAAAAGVTVGWWALAIAGAAAFWSYVTPDVFGPIIKWVTRPPEKR